MKCLLIKILEQVRKIKIFGSVIMFVLGLISIVGTKNLIPKLYEWPASEKDDNPFKDKKNKLTERQLKKRARIRRR